MITINICVYNSQKYIKELFDSIVNQTYKDFIVHVIDNNSTDDTINIINSYRDQLQIEIFKQPIQGISYARNKALEETKTDKFVFVDSDDILGKDYLKILVENIEDGVIPCIKNLNFNDSLPNINNENTLKSMSYMYVNLDRIIALYSLTNNFFNNALWNKLLDINVIRQNNLKFVGDLGEDSLFLDQYFFYFKKLKIIDSIEYFYRIYQDSLSRAKLSNDGLLKILDDSNTFLRDELFENNYYKKSIWCLYKAFEIKNQYYACKILYPNSRKELNKYRRECLKSLINGLFSKKCMFKIRLKYLERILLFPLYFKKNNLEN